MSEARNAPVVRPGLLLPSFLLIVLLYAVVSVFFAIRNSERQNALGRLREKGAERAGVVSARLAADIEALSSVRDLFHSSVSVEESEFRCFAHGIRVRLPEVVSLAWRPMAGEEVPDEGLPVLFMEPPDATLDSGPVAPEPVLLAARAGEPIYLPFADGRTSSLRFALAVRGGTDPSALSVGLVTIVLDRATLLGEATRGLATAPISIDLVDADLSPAEPEPEVYRKTIRRGGGRLAIRCVIQPGSLSVDAAPAPWIALASGLLLIGALVAYVVRMVRDAARTEKLIEEKTAALEELKRVQQRIVREERLHALGEMASGVAHDFNNALGPILGFSELMVKGKEDPKDTATVLEFFHLIHTSAKDAAQVVRRLTEFYRRKRTDEAIEPVDPREVVAEIVKLTEPKWKAEALGRGATITVSINAQPTPRIEADLSGLREALTNLVINAVDAMPQGGSITFTTRTSETRHDASGGTLPAGHAVIEVSDTGTGMTEQVRQRCMEPFFTTKGAHGTGLGLAMVYGIVRRHGGAIEIESEPGKGTCVRLRFPALRAKGEEASPEIPRSTARRRVLLVDDDPDVLRVHRRLLESEGHTVVCASNGVEALERLSSEVFDVVFSDSAMPGLSGAQLAREVRARRPAQRFVLVTGMGDLMEARSEMPEGVDRILSKPVSLDMFRSALEGAAAR